VEVTPDETLEFTDDLLEHPEVIRALATGMIQPLEDRQMPPVPKPTSTATRRSNAGGSGNSEGGE
jgi:hypothetical protein